MFSFLTLNIKTKSFIRRLFTFSDEFYYFLIGLFCFNLYIWLTLEYHDDYLMAPSHSFSFAQFERNCLTNYQDYTLDPRTYIVSVLSMDWQYRLIYLCILYRIALYFESKYQCKIKKFISNHLVSTNTQQSIKYKILRRWIQFSLHSFIFFILCVFDVLFTRYKFMQNNNEKMDDALMDYSNIALPDRIKHFIYIFIRVHPTDSWLVRISHGISYPFTLYALSRRSVSSFIYVHSLTIALWLFHIGGLAHTLSDSSESDLQLRCVRRSFIWSTRGTSIHGEAMRIVAAPYLNLVCLTINCAKYVL